jgi:hypothetical protein
MPTKWWGYRFGDTGSNMTPNVLFVRAARKSAVNIGKERAIALAATRAS